MKAAVLRNLQWLLLIVVAGVAGCTAAPIRNVSDAPVVSSKANLTADDVKEAIKRAGAGLGWGMRENGPGSIIGTLHLRTHTAVVDIKYDAKSYNITYADSKELKYNADKQTIHRNYNGWIQNLDNAIRTNLANLS